LEKNALFKRYMLLHNAILELQESTEKSRTDIKDEFLNTINIINGKFKNYIKRNDDEAYY